MMIGAMNKHRRIFATIMAGILTTLCVGCSFNPQQPDVISLGRMPTPDNWSTYTLYSAFTLSVPNTLEKSIPDDRYSQELKNKGIQRNDGIVIFQQKGLNAGSMADADAHYCRVLVQYEKVNTSDLLHNYETEVIDSETEGWLFENVKANLADPQQLITNPSYDWVDVDGTKAIRVRYSRTGNNGNTTACVMYYLFNYDEMTLVMTAYREQEANLWQSDMENVIRTFQWRQKK